MGTGVSVFLLAVGAVLTFAIEADSAEGININAVGIILMIAGAAGLIMFAAVFGRRDRVIGRRTTVVEQPPLVERRQVVQREVVERPVVEQEIVEQRPVVERRIYE